MQVEQWLPFFDVGNMPGVAKEDVDLTADLDPGNIAATMNHGVLSVAIGKAERATPRKIKTAAAE